MDRGILSTIYFQPTREVTGGALLEVLQEAYAGEPFVRILRDGEFPATQHVRGGNFCDVGLTLDRRTGRVIVVSAIDNLVKGAAGQAVQNMNLMRGFAETTALTGVALVP